MKSLAVLAVSCAFSAVAVADSSDWPSLRGPRHDGAALATLDASEGAGFAVAWRTALGAGYSVVAVAEGRAVTLFSDGQNDVAVAFDARTGKELWRHAIAPTLPGRDGSFDGPISTPALSGGRVFGLGPRGHLFGLDAATGRELWTVDLVTREGAKLPFYGFGTSPIVAGGVLVVPLGAASGGAIAGFDLATGERRWRLGDDGVAYQSPIVLSVGGREQVVAVGDTRVFGIDPAAGRLLWEHAHGGEVHPIATESIVPVPAGDGRLFLKLRQDGSAMLRLVPRPDGGATVETLWTAPVLRTTYVVPVYHGGFLYGMSGRSTLTCVDAGTGEVRWRSREPGDGFPLIVGDDLVILTKEKSLHVGKASPEGWKERARLDLFHDLVWSSPGFADGALFARSQGELARVDWRKPETASAPAAPPATATRAPASVAPVELPGRAGRGRGQVGRRRPLPRLAARRPARRVAGPGRLPLSREGERRRHRGGHDRGPARGPDVAGRRNRPLLVRDDAAAGRPDQLPLRARLRGALPRPPEPVAGARAGHRDDRCFSRGAVVARHAGLAAARPPRRGRARAARDDRGARHRGRVPPGLPRGRAGVRAFRRREGSATSCPRPRPRR